MSTRPGVFLGAYPFFTPFHIPTSHSEALPLRMACCTLSYSVRSDEAQSLHSIRYQQIRHAVYEYLKVQYGIPLVVAISLVMHLRLKWATFSRYGKQTGSVPPDASI